MMCTNELSAVSLFIGSLELDVGSVLLLKWSLASVVA
jgi:hypothetical protein